MDTLEHLLRRRARAQPEQAVVGMAFEGILRVAARRWGEEAAQGLKAPPLFPKRLLSVFKYSVADYLDLVALASKRLAPGDSFEALLNEIGGEAVAIFFEGPVGKTMVSLNAGNAQRMLSASTLAFRTVYNFGERTYEKTGERSGVFHFRDELAGPALQRGVVHAGLARSTDITPVIEVIDPADMGTNFDLRLRW